MLQLPNNNVDKSGDGAKITGEPQLTANYVDTRIGANDCAVCHSNNWGDWEVTKHAWAYPSLMNQTKDTPGYNQTCEPCHNTGAGKPSIYPATGYDPVTNGPAYLQNVTCQACHGPASNHISAPMDGAAKRASMGLVLNASLCGSCHFAGGNLSSTHHPTYDEWQVSGHNTSTAIRNTVGGNVNCAPCHEAWTSIKNLEGVPTGTSLRTADEDAPLTWELSCAVCHDPHSSGSGGTQLRLPANQICQECHTHGTAVPGKAVHHPQAEVRNNTAGYLPDRTGLDYMPSIACSECHMADDNAGLPNHTFAPNPYSCVTCHGDPDYPDNATAQAYIDAIEARTVDNLTAAKSLVDQAKALVQQMLSNRSAVLTTYRNEYNISTFNYETVESDKSSGNHNPGLTIALLNDSKQRAQAVIAHLTPPDKVTGVGAVADGLHINVTWTASTATDFAKYRIYILTSSKTNVTFDTWVTEVTDKNTVTYTSANLAAGTYYVYVTAVDADGNEITDTLSPASAQVTEEEEEEEEEGGISAMDIALIAVIAAIIVIVVATLLMRKRKGSEPAMLEKTEE